jgi:hypothetical protein
VKVAVPLLLLLMGSFVALLEMDAVLLLDIPPGGTTVLSGAVAFIVMSSVAPAGMVARVQVTTRVACTTEHDQLVPLAEMPVNPAGNVSETVTVPAASGPALRGASVKLAAFAAIMAFGVAVLEMLRSAPGETATDAVAVLLFGLPSAVVADSVAELVIVPLLEFWTVPTRVNVELAPLAREPLSVHVTVPLEFEQLQPDPEADT